MGEGWECNLRIRKVWLRQITSSSLPYYTLALFQHLGGIRGSSPAIWSQKQQWGLVPFKNCSNYFPGERTDLQLNVLPRRSGNTNRPQTPSFRAAATRDLLLGWAAVCLSGMAAGSWIRSTDGSKLRHNLLWKWGWWWIPKRKRVFWTKDDWLMAAAARLILKTCYCHLERPEIPQEHKKDRTLVLHVATEALHKQPYGCSGRNTSRRKWFCL